MTQKRIKTRERIILTSLALFNECGEPNITTIDISNEMEISPGNLYYHYHGKEAIVSELFTRFEAEMLELLESPLTENMTLAESWVYLQVVLECVDKYRFFYRDLADLLSRYTTLKRPFNRLVTRQINVVTELFAGMRSSGVIEAHDRELAALAENIVQTIVYWYGFQIIRSQDESTSLDINRAIYQIIAQVTPYLNQSKRELLVNAADLYQEGKIPPPSAVLGSVNTDPE